MEKYFIKCNPEARKKLENWTLISFNKAAKDLLPNVVVYGKQGSGVEGFGALYSKILLRNDPEKCKGECFLALQFPYAKDLKEVHRLFFSSPENYALQYKRNKFTGVFLISLEEWARTDVKNNPVFERFLKYLKEHKEETMRLCLWMPPEMKDSAVDIAIRNCLSMTERVDIHLPNAEECVEFLEIYLEQRDMEVFFDNKAKKELLNGFEQMIMDEESFDGYESIMHFGQSLLSHLVASGMLQLCPNAEDVRTVMTTFLTKYEKMEKRPIGFA